MFQVYLIDDEIWALISLEKLIPWKEYGFCICGKSNSAKKAWDDICKNPPDVVITDIRMPGMTGLELLKRLHDSKMKTQVVLVSGFAEFQYAQEAIKHGAFEYLLKQVKREQLKECMIRLFTFLSEQKKKMLETEAYSEKQFWTQMQDQQIKRAAECLFQIEKQEWIGKVCFVASCKKENIVDKKNGKMIQVESFRFFLLGERDENAYGLVININQVEFQVKLQFRTIGKFYFILLFIAFYFQDFHVRIVGRYILPDSRGDCCCGNDRMFAVYFRPLSLLVKFYFITIRENHFITFIEEFTLHLCQSYFAVSKMLFDKLLCRLWHLSNLNGLVIICTCHSLQSK